MQVLRNQDSQPALPEFEQKTVLHQCQKHGSVSTTIFKLFGDWNESKCLHCLAEQKAEQDARLKEQEAKRNGIAIERMVERSMIPLRYRVKGFDDFIPTTKKAEYTKAQLMAYAENFPHHLSNGAGFVLYGNTGTAKTHLACAVAIHVMRTHSKTALYRQVADVIGKVRESYRKDAKLTEEQEIRAFTVPHLLILDEVGVQYGTDAERNIIFRIINARYEAMMPTVLISNLAYEPLCEFVGDRVIDRMRENGGALFVFDWASQRGKV